MKNGIYNEQFGPIENCYVYYKNNLIFKVKTPYDSEYWYNEKEELHRLDGPAVEWLSGFKQWNINGKEILVKNQEEFERYLKLLAFQ